MNVGDAEYKALLRQWLTLKDAIERRNIGAQLTDAEMRFDAETHAPTMRDLVDDYDQLRNMGDLGGVEIL